VTVPTSEGARRLRSAGFAAAAVGLAVGAHAGAGGALPALPLLIGLAALVGAGASASARRRRGPVTTGAALLATQVALHVVLSAAGPSHHGGHAAHADHAGWAAHLAPSPGMLGAHALAALVLGWVLSHGEAAAGRAVALLVPVVAGPPPMPRPAARVHLRTWVAARRPRPAVTLHDLSRRGPPVAHTAARA
jgi:hypothetical protein